MEVNDIEEYNEQKVIIVGIGRAGTKLAENIYNQGIFSYELLIIDTDIEDLSSIDNIKRMQIGSNLTNGSGSGMKPNIGRDAALENYNDIKMALKDSNMVIIIAGLGGGTGTGASPIIARIAKEVNALSISLVTKPFKFLGMVRRNLANKGLIDLQKESDMTVVIENERFMSQYDIKWTTEEFWQKTKLYSISLLNSMLEIVLNRTKNPYLSLRDLRNVLIDKVGVIDIVQENGQNSAYLVISNALKSNLFSSATKGILLHFKTNDNFSVSEISKTMDLLYETLDDNATIVFTHSINSEYADGYIKIITIIAKD